MTLKETTFEQHCAMFGYTPKGRPLSTQDVAELLGVHSVTIDGWRVSGDGGPRHFKPNGTRRVWYAEPDVLAWMASGEKRSTSDTVAA